MYNEIVIEVSMTTPHYYSLDNGEFVYLRNLF